MTVDERLADISTSIAVLDQQLEAHTAADEDNFIRITVQLNAIENKVDLLRLADAARAATIDVNRRQASMFGGGVAAGLLAFVESVKYFVNR